MSFFYILEKHLGKALPSNLGHSSLLSKNPIIPKNNLCPDNYATINKYEINHRTFLTASIIFALTLASNIMPAWLTSKS